MAGEGVSGPPELPQVFLVSFKFYTLGAAIIDRGCTQRASCDARGAENGLSLFELSGKALFSCTKGKGRVVGHLSKSRILSSKDSEEPLLMAYVAPCWPEST